MTKSNNINYIDFEIMQKMCHPVAMTLFDSSKEPVTAFNDHNRQLLESALANPKQSFDGNDLYPTLIEKGAILYYSLIKNHPFENGNKRTATATLIVFLDINDYQFKEDGVNIENYLVSLATRVASSKGSEDKDFFIEEITNWLSKNTQKRYK